MLGSAKCKKNLDIALNHKLNMSQECDAIVKKTCSSRLLQQICNVKKSFFLSST